MRRFLVFSIVMTVLLIVSASSLAHPTHPTHPAVLQPADACQTFPETGFQVCGRLLEYWQHNDGLRVFGLPIGPQHEAMVEGQAVQVQWFQRNRLELHPEHSPPYDVLLGRLGVDTLEQQGREWRSFPAGTEQPGCRFFPETGHSVCEPFLQAWQENGLEIDGVPGTSEAESLALFGLPLSEPQEEVLSDGVGYTVQWFERARFELHPQHAPPYNVLFGLLGSLLQEQTAPSTPTATPLASQPGQDATGRIAFLVNQHETPTGTALYTIKPDGTDRQRVSSVDLVDADDTWFLILGFDWARDGSRFAFSATSVWDCETVPHGCYNEPNIYAVLPDGSEQIRLTDNGKQTWEVAISPNGKYAASGTDSGEDLLISQTDGSQRWVLTSAYPDLRWIDQLSWSPNGRRIAFVASASSSSDAFDFRVYVAEIDGSSIGPLTPTPVTNMATIAWSPDGNHLAINPDVNNGGILLIDADGTGERTLVDRAGRWISKPVWSPDSTRMLFYGQQQDEATDTFQTSLFIVRADGTGMTTLVDGFQAIAGMDWSPDGQRIVFSGKKEQGDNAALYGMDVGEAGTSDQPALEMITSLEGGGTAVQWRIAPAE
jgi:Tol biopolymer transport system component